MSRRHPRALWPTDGHDAGPAGRNPLPYTLPSSSLVHTSVPGLWTDASTKHCNASNAIALLSNLSDFNSLLCYDPSTMPNPTPELLINDSEHDSPQPKWVGYCRPPTKALSTVSCETQTSSSASLLSPVGSDTITVRSCRSRGPSPLGHSSRSSSSDDYLESLPLPCLGPQCDQTFSTAKDLKAHVESIHTHSCNWVGCDKPSFTTRDGLIWHVKTDHLLVCPIPACTETSLQDAKALRSHMNLAHAKVGAGGIKEWQLSPPREIENADSGPSNITETNDRQIEPSDDANKSPKDKWDTFSQELISIKAAKTKYQEQLRTVLERKGSKKNASTPRSADSPTDLVRCKASRLVETASFPLVFEHSILPFLSEFLPKWAGPHFVISVTRGKGLQFKRIAIMTRQKITRARKVIIVHHIQDLLPDKFRRLISFVFSMGEVNRITWARGLSKDHMDDICAPRNPYFFKSPCMRDSIGVRGNEAFADSTATLGPSIVVGGGNYWLGNFHPFLQAYQQLGVVQVEHPSLQDREQCLEHGHDAMSQEDSFRLGKLEVTSGLDLKTTRISHDSYWEECGKEQPLVVTDWSLISSHTSHANLLRRFPSEAHPLLKEVPITLTDSIVPGAYVSSSGRTSGHQRGQVCEIPAYLSGDENGTFKATREWFIEDQSDDEEEWIRGGIGVEGDSGAAVVDFSNNALIGQIWGRNRYWGPGPRLTYFTPIADIFDDIQEKCGQQARPQLPQHRNEDDCFPLYPSCRQCYDLRTYLDSRRSSRLSLQSMIMSKGDHDHDVASISIEAVSELATPRDHPRSAGIEEMGSSFNANFVFGPGTPAVAIAEAKSPYATALDIEDLYDPHVDPPEGVRKRAAVFVPNLGPERQKRQKV